VGTGTAIRYGPNADASRVSAHSTAVLERILVTSGNGSCLVTSTARDPDDQARVMFENCERHGAAAQRRLYKAPGRRVIAVYQRTAGKPRAERIAAMAAEIRAVGPEKVSLHCADPAVLGVVDVAPSSLAHPNEFRAAAEADPDVSRVLGPPTDPAFHLEIRQPRTA
jgi:hypothetical protein